MALRLKGTNTLDEKEFQILKQKLKNNKYLVAEISKHFKISGSDITDHLIALYNKGKHPLIEIKKDLSITSKPTVDQLYLLKSYLKQLHECSWSGAKEELDYWCKVFEINKASLSKLTQRINKIISRSLNTSLFGFNWRNEKSQLMIYRQLPLTCRLRLLDHPLDYEQIQVETKKLITEVVLPRAKEIISKIKNSDFALFLFNLLVRNWYLNETIEQLINDVDEKRLMDELNILSKINIDLLRNLPRRKKTGFQFMINKKTHQIHVYNGRQLVARLDHSFSHDLDHPVIDFAVNYYQKNANKCYIKLISLFSLPMYNEICNYNILFEIKPINENLYKCIEQK